MIAIVNQKDGTGKTSQLSTYGLNLPEKKKVLLMDADTPGYLKFIGRSEQNNHSLILAKQLKGIVAGRTGSYALLMP